MPKTRAASPALVLWRSRLASAPRVRRRDHPQRQRLDALEAVPGGRDRGVQEGQQGRHASTTAAAAAARAARIWPTWWSTSRAPTRRTRKPTWPRSRAARSSTSRSCSGPSRSATTSPASTSCSCRAETIAKIFQRDIKKWNDKAIAADNPGAKLPDLDIVVAHRADGSGTTQNFTEYLNGAAKGAWKLKSGSTVEWPSDTQAGQGNGGVAQIVKSTKGAIGYVDLSDAKASGLKFASIKNQAGKFVEPTTAARVGRRRRHRGQGQPAVQRAQRQGRQVVSHHLPDLGDRLRQADRSREGRSAEGVPQVPGQGRPEAARRDRLRAAAARACRTRPLKQLDKIQVP